MRIYSQRKVAYDIFKINFFHVIWPKYKFSTLNRSSSCFGPHNDYSINKNTQFFLNHFLGCLKTDIAVVNINYIFSTNILFVHTIGKKVKNYRKSWAG